MQYWRNSSRSTHSKLAIALKRQDGFPRLYIIYTRLSNGGFFFYTIRRFSINSTLRFVHVIIGVYSLHRYNHNSCCLVSRHLRIIQSYILSNAFSLQFKSSPCISTFFFFFFITYSRFVLPWPFYIEVFLYTDFVFTQLFISSFWFLQACLAHCNIFLLRLLYIYTLEQGL